MAIQENMLTKIKVWIKRYLPAEAFAIIGTLIGGSVVSIIFRNSILTALGGTWGENIGYYGFIILRDLKRLKEKHKKITVLIFVKLIRNLFIEFGPSEYLDSFIIRPFAMYIFPLTLHNLYLGLIVGKFAADITFYIPTIISYELKNKFFGE